MSDKQNIPLRIERMPEGGFVVSEAWPEGGLGGRVASGPLFASTSIGDAICFIAGRLDPVKPGGKPPGQVDPVRCSRCGSRGAERYCSRCYRSYQSVAGGDWASA